jgi:hypothetical protein
MKDGASTGAAARRAASGILALALAAPAPAAIKCWTNKDGVRECGNAVPPEYAQQSTITKDDRGLTVERKERAKTLDELEAERQAAAAAQQAALEAEKREALDRVLLDTFASEDDLVLTRDGQIAHLDSQIRLTESHIEKLEKNLEQMIERAADVERRGEKPSAEMIENIGSVRAQIADNKEFIAAKHREQDDIRARFDADIARFRQLKGAR